MKADKEILYHIARAEAGADDKQALKNVVYVILNRVNSDHFPNTVKEVVFQKIGGYQQFSPISDGRYWTVEITDFVKDAVDEAYSDYAKSNKAQNALFFKSMTCDADWSSKNKLFSDGKHNFYE